MARLAISKGFLAEYVRLGQDLQRAVDQAIAAFARDSQPALHLEAPQHDHGDRFGLIPVNGHWRGVVLTPGDTSSEDTYSLVTVLPQDQVDAYVTNYLFRISQPLQILEVRPDEASPQAAGPEEPSSEEAASAHQTPPEAEPRPVSSPTASPAIDAQPLPTVGLLTEDPARNSLLPPPPEVPKAAPPKVPAPDGYLTSAPAPDDQLTSAPEPEPEKVQHGLARLFAAWRSRRQSRRLARDGTSLTEEHASGSFGPDGESRT